MSADPRFCNKKELARILRCSLPTVENLMGRYPDFPVEQRGDMGTQWLFDPERVVAFLREKREAEEAAAAERADFLSQFELGLEAPSDEARGLTPTQRLALVRAQREERRLAQEAGLLIEVPKLRQELVRVMTIFGTFLDGVPQQIGRRHGLPDAVIRSIEAQLAEARQRMVDEIRRVLGGEQP